eukprot:1158973-Pelagomonas_calceolata.AAC.2
MNLEDRAEPDGTLKWSSKKTEAIGLSPIGMLAFAVEHHNKMQSVFRTTVKGTDRYKEDVLPMSNKPAGLQMSSTNRLHSTSLKEG